MLVSASNTLTPTSRLPATSASDMKRQGWRGVMATVRREGHLVITNHNVPEAVILPPEQYDRLVSAAEKEATAIETKLDALRQRFRKNMKRLELPDAEVHLSALMSEPMKINGTVIAGETF